VLNQYLKNYVYCNLSLGFVTKAKVCKGAGQEECEKVWKWRLTLPSELPFWELESWWTPKPLESDYKTQNTSHWGVIYIIGKLLKCTCLKWDQMTHLDICNTSYGKKKSRESKLAIWLPTTKSRESTWLSCVQVTCNTLLESFQWELQLCFRAHPDRRTEHEVITPQSCENSNLGNFRTFFWEFQDKKSFGYGPRRKVHSILYRGRWWLPPSLGHGEFSESKIVGGLS